MAKTYKILSPDGISIENNNGYKSIKKAEIAFDKWKQRYKFQGYYSHNGYQIPLDELDAYCSFLEE